MDKKDIINACSGDKIFKSLLEGYEGKSIEDITKDKQIAEMIAKINKQFSKIWDDEFVNELRSKFTWDVTKELRDKKRDTDCIEFREKNADYVDISTLSHEYIHMPSFVENKGDNKQKNAIEEIADSTDYVEYSEQMKDFMDYVAITKEIEEIAFIKVTRIGNVIGYGRLKEGSQVDHHEIKMSNEASLKELYETLKITYGPEFCPGSKHEMMGGWSILPTIGDNIMLEISSKEATDSEWIYEEIHNRAPQIVEEPKKK